VVRELRLAVLLGILGAACNRPGGSADGSFDVSVARPAYTGTGPQVFFDQAHREHHHARGTYAPFTRLLENDGYTVTVNREPIGPETLRGQTVLVVVTASGNNDRNDAPAFTAAECDAIEAWVRSGGSLLLVVDHYPFGPAVQTLADRFGVDLGKGSVEEPAEHDPATSDTGQLVFARESGRLGDHPITQGRNLEEAVGRVVTFDGVSIGVPEGAVPLLRLSETAVDLEAQVEVQKSGGDTRVQITYGSPRPATGRAQGIALEHGAGRVVMLGEAAMLTAQVQDGRHFGMNVPGNDNRQFALNLMHWLSRLPMWEDEAPETDRSGVPDSYEFSTASFP
jgi:hypothetical protein